MKLPLTPEQGQEMLAQIARERALREPALREAVGRLFVPNQDFKTTILKMNNLGASAIEIDIQLRKTGLATPSLIKEMVYRYFYNRG